MSAIDILIGKMTLAEKLGQLTMTASSYAVTGPVIAGDSTQAIKDGTIGNLLNMVGADHVREVQRLAVQESRLGIPLLIGFDVVHGHRTLFPIPLGEAALFDPRMWASTARESAKEAAAEGIAMTFAPMLDVARDPRWGRSAEGPGEDPWLAARIAESKVHGFQGSDLAEAATLALKAGVDIDMMSDAYRRGLPVALERGWVTVGEIDAAVRRVLTLKKRLGLFDDPYRRGAVPETAAALASRRRLARLVGSRAIVMLKNDGEALPLDNGLPRLAVVGPLAEPSTAMRGPWWVQS